MSLTDIQWTPHEALACALCWAGFASPEEYMKDDTPQEYWIRVPPKTRDVYRRRANARMLLAVARGQAVAILAESSKEGEAMKAQAVTLRECPPGLFLFDGILGFKSEYTTESLAYPGFWQCDVYVVESGEFFWGGVADAPTREELLVCPVEARGFRRKPDDATASTQ